MTASAPSDSTVLLVDSTTSDKIDPNYDLGLAAGIPVCFVARTGTFPAPSPPPGPSPGDAGATAYKYSFAIFTEAPWGLVESGLTSSQPTPSHE
jgi:hypothetical protein